MKVDDLVIIKEDNSSPEKWPMDRAIEVYPNTSDHYIRVVKLCIQKSTYFRPITQLIELPLEDDKTETCLILILLNLYYCKLYILTSNFFFFCIYMCFVILFINLYC